MRVAFQKGAAMTVLGIDPGTIKCGWAVVTWKGSKILTVETAPHGLWTGLVRLKEKAPMSERLQTLYHELMRPCYYLGSLDGPIAVAVEEQFVDKNVQTAITIGMARGVVLAAAGAHKLQTFGYPPAMVKMKVAGSGLATKETVNRLVKSQLGITDDLQEDQADAYAIAMCHCLTMERESTRQRLTKH